MKCIQCGTDNTRKDRTGNQGQCKSCHHPFVFEPTTMGSLKITDPLFAKLIADISVNKTLHFTSKQFFYLLDKRLKSKTFLRVGYSLVIYVFLNVFATPFLGIFILLFITLGSIGTVGLIEVSFVVSLVIINIISIAIFYRDSQSNNLNYQQRRDNFKALKIMGGLLLGVGIFISLTFNSFPVFVATVLLGMLSLYLGTRQPKLPSAISQSFLVEPNQFQDWLNRWTQANGQIYRMLPSPRNESTSAGVSPDISAYSFDRLLVCNSATIAQFLIANNFHFENNCAVLSVTGYPQSIFSTVMNMLRQNPQLTVYALHDASPRGVGLVDRLRSSPSWFANSNIAIIDLGLLPRQLFKNPKVFVQTSNESVQAAKQLSAAVRQDLSKEEMEWLESGKFVELESFTPQKLIQVLNRGLAGSQNLDLESGDSGDSGLILVGDTGSSIYASESFG